MPATRWIFGRQGRKMLARFAAARVLLAFDFDGTLAPIVTDPPRAHPRPETRRLLALLAILYPCAVVSGRRREDVAERMRGAGRWRVVGNHGSEPSPGEQRYRRDVRRWRRQLRHALPAQSGIEIEDKGVSLSIHFRRSPDRRQALRAVLGAAEDLAGARLVGGKCVVNVVPLEAPDKGDAIERLREAARCEAVLYLGDDRTDEDVFRRARGPTPLLTIRVGKSKDSAAEYYVRSQREVDLLLGLLVVLRRFPAPAARSGPGPARRR